MLSLTLIAAVSASDQESERRSNDRTNVYFSADSSLRKVGPNLSSMQIRAHNYLYGLGVGRDIDRAVQIDYHYVGIELLNHSRRLISDEDSPTQALSNLTKVRSIAIGYSDVDLETMALWYAAFAYIESGRYEECLQITNKLTADNRLPSQHPIWHYLSHLRAVEATKSFEELLRAYDVYFENLSKWLDWRNQLLNSSDFELDSDDLTNSLALLTERSGYQDQVLEFLESSGPSLPSEVASFIYEAIADIYNGRFRDRQAFYFYEKALISASEARRPKLKDMLYQTGFLPDTIDIDTDQQDAGGPDSIWHLMDVYSYTFDEDDIESSRPLLNKMLEIADDSHEGEESAFVYLTLVRYLAEFRALETSDPSAEYEVYKEAFKRFGLDLYDTPISEISNTLLLQYRELTFWYEENFYAAIEVGEELLNRDSAQYGDNSYWLLDHLTRLSIYYWATDQTDAYRSVFDRAVRIQSSSLKNGVCGASHFWIRVDEATSVFSNDELQAYLKDLTLALIQSASKYVGLEEEHSCLFDIREIVHLNIQLEKEGIGSTSDAFQLAQLLRLNQYTFSTNLGISKAAISDTEVLNLVSSYNQLSVDLDKSLSRTKERSRSNPTDYLNILKERERISEQIFEKQPALSSALSAAPASTDQVSNLLDEHEAFVYQTRLIDDLVLVWVIKKEASQMIEIHTNIKEVESLVRRLRESLEQTEVSSLSEIQPFDIESSHELYKLYFRPIEKSLSDITTIFLVPPDELGPIPFEILNRSMPNTAISSIVDFDQYVDVEWLNDFYEFIYVPSANGFISSAKKSNVASQRYLGIGDPAAHPESKQGSTSEIFGDLVRQGYSERSAIDSLPRLPNAKRQLEVLGQAFDKNPRIVTGADATEIAVREELDDPYSIIAFATHGLLGDSPDEPPALVLSAPDVASRQNDGLLTTFEIAELDVNANLIILSACNTATPGHTRGLNSLTSSFMHAGASTVVASHWSVEERATTELLSIMAQNLDNGETISVSSALKTARSNLLRNSRNLAYSHPLFWGAFTVRGVANDTFMQIEETR